MDCGEIEYDVKEAEKYINELHRIIEKAKEEYEYEPPSKYYREGYNTYKRIEEDFDYQWSESKMQCFYFGTSNFEKERFD